MALLGRRGFIHGTGTAAAALAGAGGRLVAAEAIEVATAKLKIRVAPLVLGLRYPWGIDFLPDGDGILVTERAGRLRLIRGGRLDPTPLAGLPNLVVEGQGGLLDVALHPDFARNGLVYLTYSGGVRGATFTGLARGRLGPGRLERLELLFQSRPAANSTRHYGSRIVFRGGHVFVSVGDRGEMERAQLLSDYGGKIVRLLHDGRVPADNPFVGRAGALPGIWALGVRNPQGMALAPSGLLWECEHGAMGGDEVNIIYRGQNYGWPVITHGRDYDGSPIGEGTHKAGMMQPRRHWTPSIAPSGLSFCTGSRFPAWRGNLFMGALRDRMLVRMELDAAGRAVTAEEHLLAGRIGRVRQVRPGPDGRLYLLTDEADGGVWTIEPAAAG
jgi:glucose/arabinose dehydrogenase